MAFKYSILTFIIGKGYEKVHEILYPQGDVEYLMITDDPELKSNTWKVVYDTDLLQYSSAFERCFRIRYNVFKYCSTDICITIDGSMQVKGSLDNLINAFEFGKYDLCLMPHPLWNDMITEYRAWVQMRNYPIDQAQHALAYIAKDNYDFSYKGLYQLCFSIKRKCERCQEIDKTVFEKLCDLSKDLDKFERLDQTIYSYVINQKFDDTKVLPVSEQVVRSYALQWYWHNTDIPNSNVFYDFRKPDKKFLFNKEVECMYLK